jgi:hypothetical protein
VNVSGVVKTPYQSKRKLHMSFNASHVKRQVMLSPSSESGMKTYQPSQNNKPSISAILSKGSSQLYYEHLEYDVMDLSTSSQYTITRTT